MNLILSLITLGSVAIVHGQQGEKGTSIIPFPRVGRSGAEARYYMEGKRAGSANTPGLIPFPRVGRGDGMHEVKRQLIPFPRVGKRPYWHYVMDPNAYEYEDFTYPLMGTTSDGISSPDSLTSNSENDIETEKRNNNGGGGMWFGPRLGKRRKRSIETDSSAEHSRDSIDTHTLLKLIRNFNWAIVPIKERRSTFTPRLGRSGSSSEEYGIRQRAPHTFTPRLGRSHEISSAEIEFDEEQQHQSSYPKNNGSRVKSESVTSSSTTTAADESNSAPFAPRIVRDHMSPRLGRSGEDHD